MFSGSATYQRELRTDRLALYSERAAVDLGALVGGWAFDGGASYDFAYDQLNDARIRITTPQVLGIKFAVQARHYTPFFDYWTIWSTFSPVGFDEARLSGTWTSRSLPLLVELGGAYREYEDTNAGPSNTTVRKDGYRGFGRVYWSPDSVVRGRPLPGGGWLRWLPIWRRPGPGPLSDHGLSLLRGPARYRDGDSIRIPGGGALRDWRCRRRIV